MQAYIPFMLPFWVMFLKTRGAAWIKFFIFFFVFSLVFLIGCNLLFANLLCPTHRIEALGTGIQPCNWLGINACGVGVACSSGKPEEPSGAGLPSCLLASFWP